MGRKDTSGGRNQPGLGFESESKYVHTAVVCVFLILIIILVKQSLESSYRSTTTSSSNSFGSKAFKKIQSIIQKLLSFIFARPSSESNDTCISENSARLYLVICAAMYGTNYVFTQILQSKMHSSSLSLFRFTSATLFFFPALFTKPDIEVIKSSIEVGFWAAIGFVSQSIALEHASASKVAFFTCLAVVIVPLCEMLSVPTQSAGTSEESTKRLFSITNFISPVISLIGVGILEFGSIEKVSVMDLLLLSTPLAFAISLYRAESLLKANPSATLLITGCQLATIAFCSMLWTMGTSIAQGYSNSAMLILQLLTDWRIVIALIYTGVVTTAWTSYVEQKSIVVLSASDTTLIYTLEPVFATAVSILVFGEHLRMNDLLGGLFIVISCTWKAVGADILSRFKSQRNAQ